MKPHICVETSRNSNTRSISNVGFDLYLTVLLCPCLTNVLLCCSQNYDDDMWFRLIFASKDICDVLGFWYHDENGQSGSLNYCKVDENRRIKLFCEK